MKKIKSLFLCIFIFCLILTTQKVEANTVVKPEIANWPINVFVAFVSQNSYSGSNYHVGGSGFELDFTYGGNTYVDFRAFCADTLEGIPMNDPLDKVVEKAKIVSPGDPDYNKRIAMAVYYGMGGPGDLTTGLSLEHRIALTSFACSYAKNGDAWVGIIGTPTAERVANDSAVFRQIKAHIDACDGPDNIQYFCADTYAVTPEGGNGNYISASIENQYGRYNCKYYQTLVAFWGYAPMGKLQLSKTLDTYESSYATVSGAEYTVYRDSGCTDVVGTLVTGEDGNTNTINVVAGTYYIKETKAPEGCRLDETKYTVDVTSGNTTFVRSNEKVKYQIRLKKVLNDINGCYGDAEVVNAKYGVYTTQDCSGTPVATLTTNEDGSTNVSNYLDYRTYYVKELEEPTGTVLNTQIYTLDPSEAVKEDDDYVATFTFNNDIIETGLKIIKYEDVVDSSEENPAEGAILRLTLNSNPKETYTAEVNENGYCEFMNIPYGTYTLSEDSSGSDHYLIIDEQVIEMFEPSDERIYSYVIAGEEKLQVYLRISKYDSDSNEAVHLSGAKFKIYDVTNKEFVSQMIVPSGEFIDVFETNEEGMLITPYSLEAGKYVLYEIEAPKGYYLNPKYNLPEDSNDLGDATKNGIALNITTQLKVEILDEDTYIYDVKVENEPLKGKLEIYKTGEMLTEAISAVEEVKDGEKVILSEEKATPVYKLQGLQGVTYEIYAAEDIKSPDGRVTYVTKGTLVDTITTEEDGYATTEELYLGEYEIREVDAPKGYTVNDNIPNVTLTNDNPYNRVEITKEEYTNDRQKLGLTFEKVFEDIEYTYGEDIEQKALFGIFAKEPIYNYQGNEIIKRNMLLDLVWVDENGDVTSEVDLPEGTYVVRELYASSPYTVSTKETEFTLEYSEDPNQEFVVVEGEEFLNTYDEGSVSLIKLSTDTMDNIILNGNQVDTTELDEKVQEIINSINGMTDEEIKEYFEENEIKVVPGAKYGVYIDEECTKPLYRIINKETGEKEKVEIVTNETGMVKLENIPLGEYYIKEIEAPKGYEVSDQVTKIILDTTNKDTMVYQALIETDSVEPSLTKLDAFTGEAIPNCVFELRDENGELKLKSITDDEGIGYIPVRLLENGKTYTYTEVDAPDIYELNTEPHEFVASYEITDDEFIWTGEKIVVENVRKDSTVTFEKLDVMDSTPIPNCKFELKSLETDYVVTGVTDENGVYVFEDVPYGRYTYTELEAPEEYLIDTTPHEITISEEQTRVIVTNERAPETGDIAVMMVMSIAVVSVIGIAFVMIRNKRKTNE